MASITWPSPFPLPLEQGYSEAAPDTSLRTKMDSGPDKLRRRYTAAPRAFSLRYHLTRDEVATLDAFFVTTVRSGTLRFNWTHPRTGAACEARFLSAPKYSPDGPEATAAVEIEVMP
ncbi:MAG: hypothetical protein JNG85_13205 [Spirochaetaceae bacterium]|nr:hypothetical protein [Spirochaetaceae bacterium]